MATKVEREDIAVMKNEIKHISSDLKEHIAEGKEFNEKIMNKLDDAIKGFATKKEFDDLSDEVESNEKRINKFDYRFGYYAGIIAVIVLLITIFVPKILSGVL